MLPDIVSNKCKKPFFDHPFDFTEFNFAIESRDQHSGCGLDGFDYFSLKRTPINYKLELLDIYNAMHTSGQYPDTWKDSYVHLINKPDGSGLRPIAMTFCLCKIFEIMIKNRLQWYCEHNHIFPADQSGFRKDRSCRDNLTNLALYVEDGLNEDRDTLAAFLDIRGAFDNVLPQQLIEQLGEIGVSNSVLCFVRHLTFERTIYTEVNMDKPRYARKGVPQGSPLSPTFYLIYSAKATQGISKFVRVSKLADDIGLYTKVLPFSKSRNLLEKAVETVRTNLLGLTLELNLTKTKLIHFNRKGIGPGSTSITSNGCEIKSIEKARFLGLTFDFEFSFRQHVKAVAMKCQKAHRDNEIHLRYLVGRRPWDSLDPV